MQKLTLPDTNFEYYVHGTNPCLLLHAGTHGDEHEVIEIVTNSIYKYESLLPDFIYVPKVSPSAVAQKTRHNARGHDSNRIYLEHEIDEEVENNKTIMQQAKFDLAVSFHEDPEYATYYIYDEGEDFGKSNLILKHNIFLKENGIALLTGMDDVDDPQLGSHFEEGYKKFHFNEGKYSGDVLNWGMNKGIIKHGLVPETPGRCSIKEKTLIIESFFELVILKYFNR